MARTASIAVQEVESPLFRPPWPVLAAALVSFVTLGISARAFATLPFLALLMLAAWVFKTRLASGKWPIWAARAALLAIIFFSLGWQRSLFLPSYMFFDTRYVQPFGQLCAAELVIQCWKKRPAGGPLALGVLLISAIVFACGADTYEDRYIPYLAPAYFTFAGLALADLRGPRVRGLAMLLAALCIGGLVRLAMHRNRDAITMWTMKLVQRADLGEAIGLSDAPLLGSTRLAAASNIRVLRLEGDCAQMHLRALVFDTYAHGAWGPLQNQRMLEPVTPARLCFAEPGQRLRIARIVERCRYLFAPLHCVGLAPAPGSRLLWDRKFRAPIINEESGVAPYSYAVIPGLSAQHQGPLCAPLPEGERRECLALPGGPDPQYQRYPAVRELAQRIGGTLGTPLERVEEVVNYLRDHHEYSLTCEAGSGDPLANFLLDGKAAHCEYFASAAVMLLRCLDVPSRYVTGYLAHESAGPGKMVVRARDAHAWAESWIEGLGWVTVEATPPSGLPLAMQPPSFFVLAMEWFQDFWARAAAWFSGLSWGQLAGWGAAAAMACGILIGLLRKARQWLQRKRRLAATATVLYSGSDVALRALALRFEGLLRRLGAPCPAHRTWQEHIAALAGRTGSAHLDLEQAEVFLKQYNAARFGTPGDGTAAQRLQAVLGRLESVSPN